MKFCPKTDIKNKHTLIKISDFTLPEIRLLRFKTFVCFVFQKWQHVEGFYFILIIWHVWFA